MNNIFTSRVAEIAPSLFGLTTEFICWKRACALDSRKTDFGQSYHSSKAVKMAPAVGRNSEAQQHSNTVSLAMAQRFIQPS